MLDLRVLLLACLALAGCATVKKELPPEALKPYEEIRSRLAGTGAAVVGDGCIVSLGAAGTVAMRGPSVDYLSASTATFTDYLAHQGITTRRVVTPFLCGDLGTAGAALEVADDAGDSSVATPTPVLLDQRLRRDAQLVMAYSDLLAKVSRAQATVPGLPMTKEEAALDLPDGYAQALRRDLGSPLVFVASVGGGQVSGMRKVLTAAASGLLSGLATGGNVVSVSMPLSTTGHALALVDLDRQALLWKVQEILPKTDPLDAAESEAFLYLWQGALFHPFLPPSSVVASNATPDSNGPPSTTVAKDGPPRLASITLVPVAAPAELYAVNRSEPWLGRVWTRMSGQAEPGSMNEEFASRYAACRLRSGNKLTDALRRELQGRGFLVRMATPDEAKRNPGRELRLRKFRGHDAVLDVQISDLAMYARPKDPNYRPVIQGGAAMLNPRDRDQPLLEASYNYGAHAQGAEKGEIPSPERFAFPTIQEMLNQPQLVEEAFDEGLRRIAQQLAADIGRQYRPAALPLPVVDRVANPPPGLTRSAEPMAKSKSPDAGKTSKRPRRQGAGPVPAG